MSSIYLRTKGSKTVEEKVLFIPPKSSQGQWCLYICVAGIKIWSSSKYNWCKTSKIQLEKLVKQQLKNESF